MRKMTKVKRHSLRGLYRWLKQRYLPELNQRIERLPQEVAMLANTADKTHTPFFIL